VTQIPRIISVDDHVLEPPNLWQQRLPAKLRSEGPRVERIRGRLKQASRYFTYLEDDEGTWADCWIYDGRVIAMIDGVAAVSFPRDEVTGKRAITYDEILPGCYEPKARLADLECNHTDVSLCFPTFPRFCGQTFLEARDKDLAHACVRAYNDWMIEEWCGGDARGRLIPLTLVPLWDADLAAAEVHRCALLGSHAITFSESPVALSLPSIHSGYWDPLWQACEETDTVVNMHIGSSSTASNTGPDSPWLTAVALTFEGSAHAFVDWLCSGILERFPTFRIALSEGQMGWMPYLLERLDRGFVHARGYGGMDERLSNQPSSYMPGRVYGCIFNDLTGLAMRETIGTGQIMFETDYPHGDSTWPNSRAVAEELVTNAALDDTEIYGFIRGNAIECYRLDRYGIES
jgi:predicted TIM-barrel fold metal-dependent hydrolase